MSKAIENGAIAVVVSKDINVDLSNCVLIKVEDAKKELNRVADVFYGSPSAGMVMFGVTGTNGKSTTSSFISSIYSNYKPCGYMGTIAIKYGQIKEEAKLTTPDSIDMHFNLRKMKDNNMRAAAIEVSSHGLALGRVETVDLIALFLQI